MKWKDIQSTCFALSYSERGSASNLTLNDMQDMSYIYFLGGNMSTRWISHLEVDLKLHTFT